MLEVRGQERPGREHQDSGPQKKSHQAELEVQREVIVVRVAAESGQTPLDSTEPGRVGQESREVAPLQVLKLVWKGPGPLPHPGVGFRPRDRESPGEQPTLGRDGFPWGQNAHGPDGDGEHRQDRGAG